MRVDKLVGVEVAKYPVHIDDRGWFTESGWSTDPDRAFGRFRLAHAHNSQCPTLRGLHFRDEVHAEEKIVSCVAGRIFDVVVDLRKGSSTYLDWFGVDVVPGIVLTLPRGVAHGYLTIEPDTVVAYILSGPTPAPNTARGIRWDDPKIGIEWPYRPLIMSEADASWPLLGARS